MSKYDDPGNCKNYVDDAAWRCYSVNCSNYRNRHSIRDGSFFEKFGKDTLKILKILIRYSVNQSRHSILQTIMISKPTLLRIMHKLIALIKIANSQIQPLGGPGSVVQIDKTILNYRYKSHRGRSLTNRTDALVIAECNPNVCRIWAETIPDKLASTLVPIIEAKVVSGSVIHTDEHRSYNQLFREGFEHNTVCHKYNFINPIDGTHTQNIESFNNCIKYEIKSRKGIKTYNRHEFLCEFVWKWNNKENLLCKIFEFIKV